MLGVGRGGGGGEGGGREGVRVGEGGTREWRVSRAEKSVRRRGQPTGLTAVGIAVTDCGSRR